MIILMKEFFFNSEVMELFSKKTGWLGADGLLEKRKRISEYSKNDLLFGCFMRICSISNNT